MMWQWPLASWSRKPVAGRPAEVARGLADAAAVGASARSARVAPPARSAAYGDAYQLSEDPKTHIL